MNTFEFEVAFSFCKEDETLAIELNNLLTDRYNTYIYLEKQNELAGKDGEMEFKNVFKNRSRVVVILYRNKWGNTPWTRMEQEAIRDRAFENGYDFTLFILTEKNMQMPEWLPKQRIWYDLERYGTKAAANVIDLKIKENFGTLRIENAEEKAKRLQRIIEFKNKKKKFLNSIEGVQTAEKEVKNLFSIIEQIAQNSSNKEIGLNFIVHKGEKYCNFFAADTEYCIQTKWESYSWNNLSDSYLLVELTNPVRFRRSPNIYSKYTFHFDLNEATNFGWLSSHKKFLSSENLADHIFKILLNKLENKFK